MSIITTSNSLDIYNYYKNLIELKLNVLLVLDIDDVVLLSNSNLINSNIQRLIELSYKTNPDNLLFLTARNSSTKNYTLMQLNNILLEHVDYNILFSSKKGPTLLSYLQGKKFDHIIFVDNLKRNIDSVYNSLIEHDLSFTLFLYL